MDLVVHRHGGVVVDAQVVAEVFQAEVGAGLESDEQRSASVQILADGVLLGFQERALRPQDHDHRGVVRDAVSQPSPDADVTHLVVEESQHLAQCDRWRSLVELRLTRPPELRHVGLFLRLVARQGIVQLAVAVGEVRHPPFPREHKESLLHMAVHDPEATASFVQGQQESDLFRPAIDAQEEFPVVAGVVVGGGYGVGVAVVLLDHDVARGPLQFAEVVEHLVLDRVDLGEKDRGGERPVHAAHDLADRFAGARGLEVAEVGGAVERRCHVADQDEGGARESEAEGVGGGLPHPQGVDLERPRAATPGHRPLCREGGEQRARQQHRRGHEEEALEAQLFPDPLEVQTQRLDPAIRTGEVADQGEDAAGGPEREHGLDRTPFPFRLPPRGETRHRRGEHRGAPGHDQGKMQYRHSVKDARPREDGDEPGEEQPGRPGTVHRGLLAGPGQAAGRALRNRQQHVIPIASPP